MRAQADAAFAYFTKDPAQTLLDLLTINAAVLIAPVKEVVLQDVQQSGHLAEDEDSGTPGLQPGEELVQQHQLACKTAITAKSRKAEHVSPVSRRQH